jgi:hypothetical protein
MKADTEALLGEARSSLHSCRACPVKGTCVFVTPRYEPGYCLHEYRLLHAFVARRLRAHPPAGAQRFERLRQEAFTFIERLRQEQPHGRLPETPAWPRQATLAGYA